MEIDVPVRRAARRPPGVRPGHRNLAQMQETREKVRLPTGAVVPLLDAAATPPFAGQPPVPDTYYGYLAKCWGISPRGVRALGSHVHVSERLGRALATGYTCTIWAWRSGRTRWLVAAPQCAEAARAAWETPIDPGTGWPVGLQGLVGPDPGSGPGPADDWDLLVWPETLLPIADPLLAKRVERLSPRDALRLPTDLRLRAARAGALERRECWAVFDEAGRCARSWLWTNAYTERVRSIGIETAEAYRGRGLAKALLGRATRDLLAEGVLPLYGVRTGNIPSQSVALSVGFLPVARACRLIEKA